MSGGSIPSVEIGQVWSYSRDCLRGTTPLSQFQIECLQRDYLAPSKAHLKRLARPRPFVIKPRPPIALDGTERRALNDAAKAGREVVRMANRIAHNLPPIQAPKPVEPVRFDYTRNATPPKGDDNWDADVIEARIQRLARETAQARAEAERVRNG